MAHKRIQDISKIGRHIVAVEYFDMKKNQEMTAKRKVHFPSIRSHEGAYINWNGRKKIVESLFI